MLRLDEVELDLTGVEYFGQTAKCGESFWLERRVHTDRGEGFPASGKSRLMILGDVDSGVAQKRADSTDDTGHVPITQQHEDTARNDIQPEVSDAYDPRMSLGQERTGNPGGPSATSCPHFDEFGIVPVRVDPGAIDLDPAGLGEMQRIHHVHARRSHHIREETRDSSGREGTEKILIPAETEFD